MLVLVGEAGLGKTSLVRQLARQVASYGPELPGYLSDGLLRIYRIDLRKLYEEVGPDEFGGCVGNCAAPCLPTAKRA